MSSIIAVPTGVKIFNWLFTMFRGRIVFKTPMIWLVAFMVTFVIGGMTGVLLAVPPVDFVLHNSAFLVAHFHNVIIGGVVFGAFAGYAYWFPKAFGFTLDERFGKASIWCWVIGFYLAFTPLYMLGLMGMTRRLQHIPDPSWQPLLLVAEFGAIVIFCGVLCQIAQLYVSIRTRESRLDLTGDPWNGRTLEWSTSSPPPAYNFAVLPRVETIDAFWRMKRAGRAPGGPIGVEPAYENIEMPRNSPAGFITAFFAVVMGFALIWHIWWMAIVGVLAAAVTVLAAGWSDEREHEISAAEIAQMERARLGA
jgi:cytochrome o ubiquinol oxidase subunit 1